VKSHHHFGATPWTDAAISGWGLAPEGTGKISKSRGGGPMPPMEMLEQYSADAVRYWTSSTVFGRDSIISEEKIQIGEKLITKLWNVARFAERFLTGGNGRGEATHEEPSTAKTVDASIVLSGRGEAAHEEPCTTKTMDPSIVLSGRGEAAHEEPCTAKTMDPSIVLSSEEAGGAASPLRSPQCLSPADRWILARTQRLIRRVTDLFQGYDYAAAKSEIETFFWRDLADNYLEMAKLRLYNEDTGAVFTVDHVLIATLKLFAPFLPHVTEAIYQALFAERDGAVSIHLSQWPQPDARFEDADAEAFSETLVEIATAVRRYKSERGLSLGAEIGPLHLAVRDAALAEQCRAATQDLMSVTRAQRVEVVDALDGEGIILLDDEIQAALEAQP